VVPNKERKANMVVDIMSRSCRGKIMRSYCGARVCIPRINNDHASFIDHLISLFLQYELGLVGASETIVMPMILSDLALSLSPTRAFPI
jgi:hypothetical protein